MSEGFPLLTTKKMAWKTMVTELLWFLRGDTNIKYLVDNGCHIWDGDAYKRYLIEDAKYMTRGSMESWKEKGFHLSKEEFIERIKTDSEFAKKWGELGPIYGKQWRSWGSFKDRFEFTDNGKGMPIPVNTSWDGIDQITNLIKDLKANPDSRRLMVSAWNVGEIDSMVLPPCHYGFQVYTRELSEKERLTWMYSRGFDGDPKLSHEDIDSIKVFNTPKRAISLMWNQRSVDTFLGLPFNIASYALLLEIIAKEVNMIPDELIGNLGDTHLYSNHIEQAKEQIGRELTQRERLDLLPEYNMEAVNEIRFSNFMDVATIEDIDKLLDTSNVPKRTREPMELPTLKLSDWYSTQGDTSPHATVVDISTIHPSHIRLENYQSHPSIKAPLSN
jgi:thymidylate synthase